MNTTMVYPGLLRAVRISICGSLLMAVLLPASTSAQSKSQDSALEFQALEDFHAAEQSIARKPVTDTDEGYRASLEKHQKTAQTAGDLKSVLAAKQAIADLDAGRQSLVSDDPGVAGIQKAYIARREKADSASKQAIAKIDQAHLASLKKLVVELTKAGHIDQAQNVQAKVDRLAEILNPKTDPQQAAAGALEIEVWKKKAQEEFPALKDPSSPLSQRLKALMTDKKATPSFFNNPQWPYLLAKEASHTITKLPNANTKQIQSVADPLDAGLIYYNDFDAETANDQSGLANDGTFTGTKSGPPMSGKRGMSRTFDGKNDFLLLPININPSKYPKLTICVWVNPARNPTGPIVTCDNGRYDRMLCIDKRGSEDKSAFLWSAFCGNGGVLGSVKIVKNNWVFLAASYNQETKQVTLTVNSRSFKKDGVVGEGHPFTTVGHNPTWRNFFEGDLDDLRIYSRELTAKEVEAVRSKGL